MLLLYNVDWHVVFTYCGLACFFSITWIGMLLLSVDWHIAFI
jgi:hypothetical protein